MREKWRRVLGDRKYLVSNFGRIKDHGFIIDCVTTRDGYSRVYYTIGESQKKLLVHRLVAEAFIGPCPKGKEVNHKDLDKSNNYYKNLEYLTHAENLAHAKRHGVKFGARPGEMNPNAKLTRGDVISIKKLYNSKNLSQDVIARKFNISQVRVSQVISSDYLKRGM